MVILGSPPHLWVGCLPIGIWTGARKVSALLFYVTLSEINSQKPCSAEYFMHESVCAATSSAAISRGHGWSVLSNKVNCHIIMRTTLTCPPPPHIPSAKKKKLQLIGFRWLLSYKLPIKVTSLLNLIYILFSHSNERFLKLPCIDNNSLLWLHCSVNVAMK